MSTEVQAGRWESLSRTSLPGFRLSKVELFNWGTFDDVVHGFNPRGESILLVGKNGTGKSTLVDALLTLLVRPNTRNYNVAAGASKTERDEKTYIQGAFDKTVGDDGKPKIQYLRPGNKHYSALLACFENSQSNRSFTVGQVLYLDSNNKARKIYLFHGERERGIVQDLGNLGDGPSILTTLKDRGFQATDSYTQYFEWLRRLTGFRPKAMDMFNQAAWVKDVQRLDSFVRAHMLEKKPWNEKVSQLLSHFNELSEAHRALVQVRLQADLLTPIMQHGERYSALSNELATARNQLGATPLYFNFATKTLLEPLCVQWQERVTLLDGELQRIEANIEQLHLEAARLKVEIENSGGDRLRQLPDLIQRQEELATIKSERRIQFEGLLRQSGLEEEVTSQRELDAVLARVHSRAGELQQNREDVRGQLRHLQYEIGRLQSDLTDDRSELEALEQRKGNMPQGLVELRDRLCQDLKLLNKDLPFTAELMTVDPAFRDWEASIEQVLHGFARDLLVPEKLYAKVSGYIDRTRLLDSKGRGQRLSYTRVTRQPELDERPTADRSLYDMLEFREGHPLTPWVRGEILRRFDFLACETVVQFQQTARPAMTLNRHTKKGRQHHQKDDRATSADRRFFVLGWDNRGKRLALQAAIESGTRQLQQLEQREGGLQSRIDRATKSLGCLEQAANTKDFDAIDEFQHRHLAQQLTLEREKLLNSNDKIRELKSKQANVESEIRDRKQQRDELSREHTLTQRELDDGRNSCQTCDEAIAAAQRDGSLDKHRQQFASIEQLLARTPLALDNFATLQSQFQRDLVKQTKELEDRIEPIRKDLAAAIGKFLTKFPSYQADITYDVESLPAFQELEEQIRTDDLPRHEKRFKERLNEKVLTEVGVMHSHLENEREEIRRKIEEINEALRCMEWRAGTHIRLEPCDTKDVEIRDFRREVAGCLTGYLDGTLKADEVTFLRIEKLVAKLRDDNNSRWREKVVDVRNWFNFSARELNSETGEPGSYYDGGTGQSGGEKARLAFLVLVAAIVYQYDIKTDDPISDKFHFVMVDEMFSRTDDPYARYALDLFKQFGLQLLIVAPLDAKARVCEQYVGLHAHVVKDPQTNRSELLSYTSAEYDDGNSV